MPTYEYKCDACGHAFEAFQSMSADPIRKCPKCKKLKVKRLIGTGAGLIFKGSGFYITDYRDKSYTDKAKAESGATESKSDSSGDANKPAAKSDSSTETKPAATETKTSTPSESKPESKESGKKRK